MTLPAKARALLEKKLTLSMATCDAACVPNVVPMLQYWLQGEDGLVVGDLFMNRTRSNIEATGGVCFCACDDGTGESYKYVGTADYRTEGPELDMANRELARNNPGKSFRGVVVARITGVYVATRGARAGERLEDD